MPTCGACDRREARGTNQNANRNGATLNNRRHAAVSADPVSLAADCPEQGANQQVVEEQTDLGFTDGRAPKTK